MNLIYLALVGLVAGSVAKMFTKQKETGGWISSIIIGIIGSFVGSFIPLFGDGIVGVLIRATIGAFVILFVYHRFLAEKLKLKV